VSLFEKHFLYSSTDYNPMTSDDWFYAIILSTAYSFVGLFIKTVIEPTLSKPWKPQVSRVKKIK